MKKETRTISGVTPVAVMSQPAPCPGHCVYCPDFSETPRSYTPHSPAVIRAIRYGYDPGEQVKARLRILADMGHPTDKIELIIMGGTFLATPLEYQNKFIKACFDALNGIPSETLQGAQQQNELALNRAVGLCIETRPDVCEDREIERMISWGVTRVELGVQMIDDSIYNLVKRGHRVSAVIKATERLRRAGLKVHYHWMPGLPGSSPEHDLELTRQLFDDPSFRPDGLKIYPTMVIENTELETWRREGLYTPYSNDIMIGLIAEIKKTVPAYVRISRVLRDIPAEYITDGLRNSLRDGVQARLNQEGSSCHCIRCREFGLRKRNKSAIGSPSLRRIAYEASHGLEIFLSYEDANDTLYGLLRLRIQDRNPIPLLNLEGNVALIRELHVYGSEVGLKGRDKGSAQHRGYGRELVKQAEDISAKEFGANFMAVLAGVGARAYYRELGYEFLSGYMVKKLSE